jgi:hypothetical protein
MLCSSSAKSYINFQRINGTPIESPKNHPVPAVSEELLGRRETHFQAKPVKTSQECGETG